MTPDEILITVKELQDASRRRVPQAKLKHLHAAFAERYPALFEKATDPSFDMKYLEWMVSICGNVNESNVKEMDEKVYGELKKEYVDPYVKET